jgi:hypothetical protein
MHAGRNGQLTVEGIYNDVVKTLSPGQRLKLATLILNDIPEQAVVDYSTEWSDEDLHDFSIASLTYIEQRLLEDEENDSTG